MPSTPKKVFISSTAVDLPEYRKAAIHACQRLGFVPLCMEEFPPDSRYAVSVCLGWVDEADVYLGIYAHRYGYVPDRSGISLTEMEYQRAQERGLPVLLFVVDPDFPWPPSQIEKSPGAESLERFKAELGKHHVFRKFREVEDFKQDLLVYLPRQISATEKKEDKDKPEESRKERRRFLPRPPAMYSAPPYISSTPFIGRVDELESLDAWARSSTAVLVVEAIGGVGKSALTWKWTQERARKAIPDLTGIVWWSFYETGTTMDTFLREVLAYVTETDPEELRQVERQEQVERLLAELESRPHLLILDGFERVLTAYSRLDPSKLRDEEAGEARKSEDPRALIDSRDADLLRRLTASSPSKVLISTRLFPTELKNRAGVGMPGVERLDLGGLSPDDAVALMNRLGVNGSRAAMERFLDQFDHHSLLIGALAGRIRDYRKAPGQFDRWLADRRAGGSLHLKDLDLKQRRTHILHYAFGGLSAEQQKLLCRIAVFSDAVDYATIAVLNPYLPPEPEEVVELEEPDDFDVWDLEEGITAREVEQAREHERLQAKYAAYQIAVREYLESSEYQEAVKKFDQALSDLEDLGLLLWDRQHDRYDLHPVVRGHAFDQLEERDRVQTYERIRDHFESLPSEDPDKATELSDLKQTLQIYRALLGAGHLDEAVDLYRIHLSDCLLITLAAYPTVVELLQPLFTAGLDKPPALSAARKQGWVANQIGFALSALDRDKETLDLTCLAIQIFFEAQDWTELITNLCNYSIGLHGLNRLASSSRALELTLQLSAAAEDESGYTAGTVVLLENQILTGQLEAAQVTSHEVSARPAPHRRHVRPGRIERTVCRLKFHFNTLTVADLDAAQAVAVAGKSFEVQLGLHSLYAELALRDGEALLAIEHATHAVAMARKSGQPDVRYQGCLARALTLMGRAEEARNEIEKALEVEPIYCDAAEVHLQIGDHDKAREHALRAYEQAWADGPPYVWWWELERSKKVLTTLGVPEPVLPPFDPAKIEPIPYEEEIRAVIAKLKAAKKKKLRRKAKRSPTEPAAGGS